MTTMPEHGTRYDAQGAFCVDYGEWAAQFWGGPGCDPAAITAEDVAWVMEWMRIFDSTVSDLSFAATLDDARAVYAWMTNGEE
jgi:hypothetical protein